MRRSWLVVLALVVTLGVGVVVGRSTGVHRGGSAVAPSERTGAPEPSRPADPSRIVYRVPVDGSPVRGPADALVTIVESSDFQCPFCKRALPTLKQIESTYGGKVRFVFKHNPLPMHDKAVAAAVAAEQARVQGGDEKFWAMHDEIFGITPELHGPMFEAAAQRIGLDVATFRAGLASAKHEARIRRDQQLVTSVGAAVTPSFFINGRKLEGALPFERFKTVIDEELRSAEERVRAGTPPGALYASIIEGGATRAIAPPAAPAAPTASRIPLRPDDPVRGPKASKVTIALFSDFQCPFCARVEPTLKQISDTYGKDVRIVWKHQPLGFHPNAMPAARAAEAAREQGKFWRMHDLMFAGQQELSPAKYEAWAKEIGLDSKQFQSALSSAQSKARIEEDMKLGNSVGAAGTPTMFVNCRQVVGAKSFAELKTVVDQEIARADELIKGGTKLDGAFYDRICERNVGSAVAAAGPTAAPIQVDIRPDDPAKGNARAAVTIVAFSDFQCPFCAQAEPTLTEAARVYGDKVRFVWKHQPLAMHPNAMPAALAAEAAREQGKFWEMHDKLFANQASLSTESYERWAVELGLDVPKFRLAVANPATRVRVQQDQALGWKIGAKGTPTFFVNGEPLVGAVSFEQFKTVIDRQLSRLAQR
jgi:protein-disulfide isomerase